VESVTQRRQGKCGGGEEGTEPREGDDEKLKINEVEEGMKKKRKV